MDADHNLELLDLLRNSNRGLKHHIQFLMDYIRQLENDKDLINANLAETIRRFAVATEESDSLNNKLEEHLS